MVESVTHYKADDGSIWPTLALVKKHMKKNWLEEWDSLPEEKISAFGIIGRILSDSSDLSPIYSLWSRWMCFDKKGREWDQPYFALQADKGETY